MPERPTAARVALPLALAAVAALAACAGAGRVSRPAAPGEPAAAARRFPVPIGGHLELQVPAGWKVAVGDADPPLPPAIEIDAPDRSCVVLLTPIHDPDDAPDAPARPEVAQALAERARRAASARAAERELPLEELAGDGVRGYWFRATDRTLANRAPDPGEWRNLMQGAAAVGRILVAFTVLDQGDGPHRARVLELLRSARDVPPDGAVPAPPRHAEAAEAAPPGTEPLEIGLPGRGWSVLVDLPGFTAAAPRAAEDGKSVHVLAQGPGGSVVSVVLQDTGTAIAAASCRDADWARIEAGVKGLREVRRSEPGGVPRVRYLAPARDGDAAGLLHAHAWLAHGGVCANVHASRAAGTASDEAALDRILASARLAEAL
jgi:hypothetical protein